MIKMSRLPKKQRSSRLFIILALALIVSTPAVLPHQAAAQTSGYYNKSFAWDYNGQHWTWNLSIPVDLYNAYKSVPVSTRTHNGPAGYGFLATTKDQYVQTLSQKLNETATKLKYDSFDQVSFVLAFVQSLTYTSDKVTSGYDEYPRFPIETLVDDGGDCEDTAILFATLTLDMGYGTVFINPPNHYAVGILGNDLTGTYWTYPEGSNKTYYYCETTGNGFTIGQLPDEFSGQSAYLYSIDESTQFIPDVVYLPTPEPSPTDATITLPTPTSAVEPIPTDSVSPTITQPSVQPLLPLSFNLITDNPLMFVLVTFAIVVSIALAVWSIRKPKRLQAAAPSVTSQVQPSAFEDNKFCIHCGSSNKAYAAYCEKCGKQIGQQPT